MSVIPVPVGSMNTGIPAVILSGQQVSAAIPLAGLTLVGFKNPSALTGTAITFEVCESLAGTYVPLNNADGAVSYTVDVAQYYAVDPKDFYGVSFLKIKSGTTEGADRTVLLAVKGF